MSSDEEYLENDGRPLGVEVRNDFFRGAPRGEPVSLEELAELLAADPPVARRRTLRDRVADRLILWADVLNLRAPRAAMRLFRVAVWVRG